MPESYYQITHQGNFIVVVTEPSAMNVNLEFDNRGLFQMRVHKQVGEAADLRALSAALTEITNNIEEYVK